MKSLTKLKSWIGRKCKSKPPMTIRLNESNIHRYTHPRQLKDPVYNTRRIHWTQGDVIDAYMVTERFPIYKQVVEVNRINATGNDMIKATKDK